MNGGVSIWWATPADPRHHFSSEELARSERYHRPVRMVAVAATIAKGVLLIAVAALFSMVADGDRLTPTAAATDGGLRRWYGQAGVLEAVLSTRVVAAVVLSVLALWLPMVIADGWYEFRFGREAEHQPVPVRWFALTTITLAAISILILVPVVGLGYRHAARTNAWPIVFIAIVATGFGLWSLGERWVRSGSETPVKVDSSAGVELAALARRFDLEGLPFFVGRSRHRGPVTTGSSAPNAFSTGVFGHRRVVVTEALLDEEPAVRDFVVAHELTHVAKRHVFAQTGVAVVTWALIISGVAAAATTGRPWTWFSLNALDPLGLPVVVLVGSVIGGLASPIGAWISRANERVADRGAVRVMGPISSEAARRLQVSTVVDLDPPPAVRLQGRHPAPAERLEILARLSR